MQRKPKSEIIPATPSDYKAVVDGAAPGDTVQLGAGSYSLELWGVVKSGEVVIEPAPGAAPVVTFAGLNGAAFLTLRGLHFVLPSASAQYGVQAWDGASNLLLDELLVEGWTADPAQLSGVGVSFRNVTGPNTLRNSVFRGLGSGIGLTDAGGCAIEGNHLENLCSDGILMGGAHDSLIAGNTGATFNYPEWVHPDFIQWFNTANTETRNLQIIGNRFDRGAGMLVQGIFGEDGQEIHIEDNVLYGCMYNAISVARSRHFSVKRNYVQPLAVEGDSGCWIIVRQEADDGDVIDNAAPDVRIGASDEAQPTNIRVSGTTTTTSAPPGDMSQYNAWKAGLTPPDPGPTPPDGDLAQKVKELVQENMALKVENEHLSDQVAAQAQQMADAVAILTKPLP
jgi:hypothetical protein